MGGLSEASRLRMTERSQYEVIVIGAGIAGASFAHFLSQRGVTDVLLVERESVAGYHATGRSAAMAFEFDPDATVQRLKVAGVRFLREPGEGFSHNPLLEPRGVLLVYKEPLWSGIQNVAEHTWKAQGLAIDPGSGNLFILDRASSRIVRLEPEPGGRLRGARVSRIELTGIAGTSPKTDDLQRGFILPREFGSERFETAHHGVGVVAARRKSHRAPAFSQCGDEQVARRVVLGGRRLNRAPQSCRRVNNRPRSRR